jgi:hypothetical protein
MNDKRPREPSTVPRKYFHEVLGDNLMSPAIWWDSVLEVEGLVCFPFLEALKMCRGGGVVKARIRIGWYGGCLIGGVHIISEQGIVKRNSRAFFERFSIINDMSYFLDQGKVLRRVVSCRGDLDRDMRLTRFLLMRGVRLVFDLGVMFWRVFFGE